MNLRTNHIGETLIDNTETRYGNSITGRQERQERVRKLRAHIRKLEVQYSKQIGLLKQLANAIEQENK